MSGDSQFSLSELIDLEVIAGKDRGAPVEILHERDGKIARRLQEDSPLPLDQWPPEQLLKSWVGVQTAGESPGKKFVSWLRVVDLTLVLFGLLLGAGAAGAVLRYDGSTPVNAVEYLGVFVGLQLLFLLALSVSVVFGPRFGFVQELIRSFIHIKSKLPEVLTESLITLRRIRKMYSVPEYWMLLTATQRFGVAFNVGSLAVAMYLISTSDLAFRWSTTLDVSPEGFHKLLSVLSAPWSFLGDQWTLSVDQIRETRYFRFEGRYTPSAADFRIADPAIAGSWWRFLIAAQVTYGLIPRLILFLLARIMSVVSLRSIKFDSLAWGAVSKRLVGAARGAGTRSGPEPLHGKSITLRESPHIILWRDFPASEDDVRSFLHKEYGVGVKSVHKAGGSAADPDGSRALSAAGNGKADWAIFVEDWESPGLAIKQLAGRLRDKGGDVLVVPARMENGTLVAATGARLALWRKHVDQMADPQIGMLI